MEVRSNADMCSDVAGWSSSGSGDLFELSDRLFDFGSSSRSCTFTINFPQLLQSWTKKVETNGYHTFFAHALT